MGKQWEFFESINEIVYAADMENHELVYMNKKALEAFGLDSLEEVRGKKCYQVLWNRSAPCGLCGSRALNPGGIGRRQFPNPQFNGRFPFWHTILEEDGRRYRLEMAVNVSGQEEQGLVMRSVQNLESILNEGLRVALLEKTPDQSLEVLLGYLGKALNGERTYIFERNESGGDDNTYEWVAGGVRPEKENLQNVPPEVCANWYRKFSVGKHIVIKSIEDIRQDDPLQYENLKRQNIHSLVVVPLYDDGEIIGFYGVDNPPVKSLEYTSDMLQITAHFIVSSLRRRNLVRELQNRSYDVLYSLNVDYLGIYQVDFETDQCLVYRPNERLRGDQAVRFEDGYQAAMEQYISRYVVPEDQLCLRSMTEKGYVLAQLRTKQKFFVRYQVRDNPQGVKNLELHFSSTGREGEDSSAIFAFRDVNSVVEQEEETLLKVRRANSAKTEFLSHMSHDIRTPINGILGMLAIIEKNPNDAAKQRECQAKIRVASKHLLSLINDVLEISKLESGETILAEEPFDLRDVLKNCAEILGPKAEESGVRLEMRPPELQHSSLMGSPLHLRQILINVMGNAVKYNRPNGSVLVEVRELGVREDRAAYRFVVEDTGIGMTEEFQKRIFEPFVQERHDARTNYNGTGLGMAITKKLVDQMGGEIGLESRPGVGTRFQITLSLKTIDEAPAPLPEVREEEDGPVDILGMRVLVVEDNALNCEIVQYMLEDAGATVVTAENGEIAVDIFAASAVGSFDCILMDLMMPVMDGLDASRAIRGMERPDAKTVPMIALSANSFYEDAKVAKEAGMDEHLPKPVDIDKLFQVMCRLKNRRESAFSLES